MGKGNEGEWRELARKDGRNENGIKRRCLGNEREGERGWREEEKSGGRNGGNEEGKKERRRKEEMERM